MKFDFNIEDIAIEEDINPNLNGIQLNPDILKMDETFNMSKNLVDTESNFNGSNQVGK